MHDPDAALPELGVGTIWWPALDPLCRADGLIQVVEAEPEAFWIRDADRSAFRSHLAAALDGLSQPKLLHGVGAPLGAACDPPPGHIDAFAADVIRLAPAWVSEHLSFSSFAGEGGRAPFAAGFLLPPAQSGDGIAITARNIRNRRAALGTPIAFETNVSYLPPHPGEIADGAFAAMVAEDADAGILLDLHNVFCNARNGRQPVAEFCDALPLERVWEIHLAGGEDMDGFRLDAHSGLVEPELLELAADLVPRLGNLRAIIFEIGADYVPHVGLTAIGRQLEELHDLWGARGTKATSGNARRATRTTEPIISPQEWEALLGCEIVGLPTAAMSAEIADWWRSAAPALDVYRKLAQEGRAGMLVPTVPRTVRLLLQRRGSAATRALLAEFWSDGPPGYTAVDEAQAFLSFMKREHATQPELTEAIAADEMGLRELGATSPG